MSPISKSLHRHTRIEHMEYIESDSKILVYNIYLAILTGLPLFRDSSSANSWASRSMRSASLVIRAER